MFPSAKTSLTQRALDALRLTRSFLTLEDDYSVDWEVDWDEPSGEAAHPHRVPLRGGFASRRPGEPAGSPQLCLSPISPANAPSRARLRRSAEMLSEPVVAHKR